MATRDEAYPSELRRIWLELDKLREWKHEQEKEAWAYRLWKQECDRQLREYQALLARWVPVVEKMQKADDIADAVAERLQGSTRQRWKWWQRLAAGAVAAAAVADPIMRAAGL